MYGNHKMDILYIVVYASLVLRMFATLVATAAKWGMHRSRVPRAVHG